MSQGLARLEQQGRPPGKRQQSGKGEGPSVQKDHFDNGQHFTSEQWALGGGGWA